MIQAAKKTFVNIAQYSLYTLGNILDIPFTHSKLQQVVLTRKTWQDFLIVGAGPKEEIVLVLVGGTWTRKLYIYYTSIFPSNINSCQKIKFQL